MIDKDEKEMIIKLLTDAPQKTKEKEAGRKFIILPHLPSLHLAQIYY